MDEDAMTRKHEGWRDVGITAVAADPALSPAARTARFGCAAWPEPTQATDVAPRPAFRSQPPPTGPFIGGLTLRGDDYRRWDRSHAFDR